MTIPTRKRFRRAYVEIGNVCNLRCGFCPEPDRPKALMDRPLFERVLDEVGPLADEVAFHLWGEPLAHPRFTEFVGICAERKAPVNLTTNGTLMNAARIEAMLNPVVRQVNFSLHSFEANHPATDITPYLDGIIEFTRLAFRRRPDLHINYRLWNLDGENSRKNGAVIDRLRSAFGVELESTVDPRWKKGRHVVNRLYLNFDSRFDWPALDAPFRSETGTCRALTDHIGILADGTVVPCCLDKDGIIPLGDATRRTLTDILSDERAAAMKRGFQEGRLVESLCQRCTFVSRFDRQAARLVAA